MSRKLTTLTYKLTDFLRMPAQVPLSNRWLSKPCHVYLDSAVWHVNLAVWLVGTPSLLPQGGSMPSLINFNLFEEETTLPLTHTV